MYDFPNINHIDDVRPHLNKNFIEVNKEGITIINYVNMDPDNFPPISDLTSKIRRECRGIGFYTDTGEICRRPFHKFFNKGERDEELVAYSLEHIIENKLDGSMIAPMYYKEGWRLGTKMGVTDIAMKAETFLARSEKRYGDFVDWCYGRGLTPIFEYVGPHNKVVLDYEENLVLLSIRLNNSGSYLDSIGTREMGEIWGIPTVKKGDINKLENTEGVVIVAPNGHREKVKTEWYVTRHRSKDLIKDSKTLVKMILNEELDDIIPLLTEEDLRYVRDFEEDFWSNYREMSKILELSFLVAKDLYEDKKGFATSKTRENMPYITQGIFYLWDEKGTVDDYTKSYVLRNCQSNKKFKEMDRWLNL